MSKNGPRAGKVFIISSPSGGGKTTLAKRLLASGLGLVQSISMTTRPKRPGEKNGRDYYFATAAQFKKGIWQNKFLEWTKTYGWHYGTPKKYVAGLLSKGKNPLLIIDVKGAMKVKKAFGERAVLIFVAPPSIAELKKRLKKRAADDKKEIAKRLRIAKRELSYIKRYDHCVVNDSVKPAVSKLKSIIRAETCKTRAKDL
ncbi:MAG: guanylate kinase [Candidatus Omnitrophica bacterium]|nr:guanylate kinase [Candidatus Omnitrophota bacterium]